MKNITRYLLLFLGLMGSQLLAQRAAPEYLHVDVDKDFYVAGEDLWYNVFFLQPHLQQSNIVYVDLIAPSGQTVAQQIIRANDWAAKGDMVIPTNLKDGYYRLRAYTQWNLNFGKPIIFTKDIPIYSPDRQFRLDQVLPSPEYSPMVADGFDIKTDQSNYEINSTVRLSVSESNPDFANGIVSVSIQDLRYASPPTAPEVIMALENLPRNPPRIRDEANVIPAETSISHQFKVTHPDTKEPINSNFIAGFVHQSRQKIIEVSKQGVVNFSFEDFYNNSVLQIFDTNPFRQNVVPIVELVPKVVPEVSGPLNQEIPPLSEVVMAYINDNQKRFLIHKLFKNPSNQPIATYTATAAPLQPSSSYMVEDYVATTSTVELINDFIPPIKVISKKVKDPETKEKSVQRGLKLYIPYRGWATDRAVQKPPMLLINDYLTYNIEAILGLTPKELREIDIFNDFETRGTQFGPIGNFGVVAFYTHNGETPDEVTKSINNIEVEGLYPVRDFEQSWGKGKEQDKIPSLNPVLYWNPQVKMEGARATVEFNAGDRPGTYLVRVEGISKDGEAVYSEAILNVAMAK